MGRFWVILIFSIVYLIGLLGLTLVNWIPSLAPVNGAPGSGATIPLFWLAMYLMALGSGGIKPCVLPLAPTSLTSAARASGRGAPLFSTGSTW